METNLKNLATTAKATKLKRSASILLAFGLLMAACGSASTDTDAASTDTTDTTETVVTVVDVGDVADGTGDVEQPANPGDAPLGQAPQPADGDTNTLSAGPQNVGEHGPFSNADFNRDETVTRAELDEFMTGALEREIGLVAFFELYDNNGDEILDAVELATVDPAYAFDGTDANEDGNVSREEVTDYANEEGRSYRAIGLGEFFDLVDTNANNEVSSEEIEAAHESGLLSRF